MQTRTLTGGVDAFEVSVRGDGPAALFAVGSGGDPGRHGTLLDALADAGFTIVAPHFPRLASPRPSGDDLTLRARRLSLALDACAPPGAAVGVGHSVGASVLLAMAGAELRLGPGRRVPLAADGRLGRLALLAPPTGFFRAPGALDRLRTPARVWVGSKDAVTPPDDAEALTGGAGGVEVRVVPGAGHYSFMDRPPPHAADPLPDRAAFLRSHAGEVVDFLTADGAAG